MFEEKRPQSDTKNDTARYLQTQKYYFYYYYYKLYTEYKRERERVREQSTYAKIKRTINK